MQTVNIFVKIFRRVLGFSGVFFMSGFSSRTLAIYRRVGTFTYWQTLRHFVAIKTRLDGISENINPSNSILVY